MSWGYKFQIRTRIYICSIYGISFLPDNIYDTGHSSPLLPCVCCNLLLPLDTSHLSYFHPSVFCLQWLFVTGHVELTVQPLLAYLATQWQPNFQPDETQCCLMMQVLVLLLLQGQEGTFFCWSGVFLLHISCHPGASETVLYAAKKVVHIHTIVLSHQFSS